MTEEELEKEAIKRVDAFIDNFSQDVRSTLYDRLNQEDVKDFLYGLYIDSAEPREKRIVELEAQIEKMKKYIKACWVEENLNDYSSYITNSSDEFRDLVKELNAEVKNGR